MNRSEQNRLRDAERFARLLATELGSYRSREVDLSREHDLLSPELEPDVERAYEFFRSRAGSSAEARRIFRAELEKALFPGRGELLRALFERLDSRLPPPAPQR